MISRIRGTVLERAGNRLTIDVQGMGYEITVTPDVLSSARIDSSIDLFTHVVIREDAWTIYGFSSPESRAHFLLLQSVNGVGPKVAFSIVCVLASDELSNAIAHSSQKILESVPGVGKKMAARIILELQEKISPSAPVEGQENWREQLRSALVGLGYSQRESDEAIESAVKASRRPTSEQEISELLKLALSQSRRSK